MNHVRVIGYVKPDCFIILNYGNVIIILILNLYCIAFEDWYYVSAVSEEMEWTYHEYNIKEWN